MRYQGIEKMFHQLDTLRKFSTAGLISLIPAVFTSCALKDDGSGDARVNFEIQGPARNPAEEALEALARGGDFSTMSAPTVSSSFDCLAVNVMGPGIQPLAGHNGSNGPGTMGALEGGDLCKSYPGVTSPSVAIPSGGASTDLELMVPKGNGRYIQLLGVVANGSSVCSPSARPFAEATTGSNSTFELFEIGHQSGKSIFGDISYGFSKDMYDTLTVAQQSARQIAGGSNGNPNCGGMSSLAEYLPTSGTVNDFVATNLHKFAQSFTVGTGTHTIKQVKTFLRLANAGSVDVTYSIKQDASGPLGTLVPNSTSTAITLTNTGTYQEIKFNYPSATRPSINTAGLYWLIIEYTTGGTQLDIEGTSTDGYAGGIAKTWLGSAWNPPTNAVDFKFGIYK
jgi:hypothetical protein